MNLFPSMHEHDLTEQRKWMVDSQIRRRGISDERVLGAMLKVERHLFIEDSLRLLAYRDSPLSIGFDQTISQPYIVALMAESASLDKDDVVLEVGTGSGYQAAILAELVRKVYSVEILEVLSRKTHELLKSLSYQNVRTKVADGYEGWPEHAPYDAILVSAAADHIPMPLVRQLSAGAKMIIPVETVKGLQHLISVKKREDGTYAQQMIEAVRFVPLVRSS